MKILLQFIIIALLVIMMHCDTSQASCTDNPASTLTLTLSKRITACSRNLACTLAFLCNNSFRIIKREASLLEKLVPDSFNSIITNTKSSPLHAKRLVKREKNITDCCRTSCSLHELIVEFCPDDAKVFEHFPDQTLS